ncbi:hypothetical protein [Helicobacter sp. MIT 03-1614]|uniref:hypothetical protein n=1 Tax=Helicobacter sp. MIT 03-1614 TaxID=1548147 RepID=UPI0005133A96|nr:hypothetical protein [Helicobacter sp. MIT 03-1614]
MNKFGLVLTLSLGLAFSPLCALESTSQKNAHNAQNTSLSQADAAFLFTANANNLNVVTLSDEEMQKTEGEWLGFAAGVWGGVVVCRVLKAFSKGC